MLRPARFAALSAILCFAGIAAAQTGSTVVLSYVDPSGNPTLLTQGATINFGSAALGSSVSVTIVISNRDPKLPAEPGAASRLPFAIRATRPAVSRPSPSREQDS